MTKEVTDDDYQKVALITLLTILRVILIGVSKWKVTSKSNGVYTIFNAGSKEYLAGGANLVESSALTSQSVASDDAAFQWNIQTFGPGVTFL